jgi:vacuolar-type H+-ATPase subunit H
MDFEQIAQELQMMANTGTRVPGFRRKVMVDIDRLTALSGELHRSAPMNMLEASEVVKQKDSLINLARMEAERIRATAEEDARQLTSSAREEHDAKVGESEILRAAENKGQEIKEEALLESQQIVQDAQRRAYRIINEAEASALTRRDGADNYAREVLFNLEEQLAEVLGQVRRGIDALRIEVEASHQTAQRVQNDITSNGNSQVHA